MNIQLAIFILQLSSIANAYSKSFSTLFKRGLSSSTRSWNSLSIPKKFVIGATIGTGIGIGAMKMIHERDGQLIGPKKEENSKDTPLPPIRKPIPGLSELMKNHRSELMAIRAKYPEEAKIENRLQLDPLYNPFKYKDISPSFLKDKTWYLIEYIKITIPYADEADELESIAARESWDVSKYVAKAQPLAFKYLKQKRELDNHLLGGYQSEMSNCLKKFNHQAEQFWKNHQE